MSDNIFPETPTPNRGKKSSNEFNLNTDDTSSIVEGSPVAFTELANETSSINPTPSTPTASSNSFVQEDAPQPTTPKRTLSVEEIVTPSTSSGNNGFPSSSANEFTGSTVNEGVSTGRGVTNLLLSIFLVPIGFILSIISLRSAKGTPKTSGWKLSLAGLIYSAITLTFWIASVFLIGSFAGDDMKSDIQEITTTEATSSIQQEIEKSKKFYYAQPFAVNSHEYLTDEEAFYLYDNDYPDLIMKANSSNGKDLAEAVIIPLEQADLFAENKLTQQYSRAEMVTSELAKYNYGTKSYELLPPKETEYVKMYSYEISIVTKGEKNVGYINTVSVRTPEGTTLEESGNPAFPSYVNFFTLYVSDDELAAYETALAKYNNK